jgi:hypothetical protein
MLIISNLNLHVMHKSYITQSMPAIAQVLPRTFPMRYPNTMQTPNDTKTLVLPTSVDLCGLDTALEQRLLQAPSNLPPPSSRLPQSVNVVVDLIAYASEVVPRRLAEFRRVRKPVALASSGCCVNVRCKSASVQLAQAHLAAVCRRGGEGGISNAVAETGAARSAGSAYGAR